MHRVSRRIDHLLHSADQLAQLLRRHHTDIPAALDLITPLLQASDDPDPAGLPGDVVVDQHRQRHDNNEA